MTAIAGDWLETLLAPGYRGLLTFCELIDEALEPHERRIARAHFGPAREVYAILPRGNLKTSLAAKIGLHHLLTTPSASVTIGAASRDQARICFERMRGFAQHPAIDDQITVRHLELRHEHVDGLRLLRVVVSEGARVHGLSSSLYIGDEIWAWRGDELLEAMLTGLVKRADARFLGISTAAARLDSALGRTRARAMAGRVTRKGALIDAAAPGLRWLEWSLADGRPLSDFRAIKAANPAGYITTGSLREQAQRVTPIAFAQFHACKWGVTEGSWLPVGAWSACAGDWAPPDAPVVLFVDVGGSRASTALIGVTLALEVAEIKILQGDEAVLQVVDEIVAVAERRPVIELAHDPWRFRSEALRLQREHGLRVVEVPMSQSRLVAMSESLHSAVVSQRLTHPDSRAQPPGRQCCCQADAPRLAARQVQRRGADRRCRRAGRRCRTGAAAGATGGTTHLGLALMAVRPCIRCGALIPSGSYCGRCQPNYAPDRLRGRKWMRRRAVVMRRAGFVCERCGERVAEEVHHLRALDDNSIESLLAVCVPCHLALEAEKRAAA